MMRRFNFKSIYLKLVLIFLAILWISSMIALTAIFVTRWTALKSNIHAEMMRKAEYCQSFYEKYHLDTPDLVKMLEDNYTIVSVFSSYEDILRNTAYRETMTKTQYQQILSGDTVVFQSLRRHRFMPAVAVSAGDKVLLIHPKLNLLQNFASNAYVLLLCVLIDSILIVIAANKIVRPIKKLNAATKAVSMGDFHIVVEQESGDEIGQLVENFNNMTNRLKNMEYLHKNFISNVSHEFKTPITAIQGFVKLIRDKNLSKEDREEYTNLIISETERLSNLSSNLLRLATIENNAYTLKTTCFSLDEQIRRVLLLLESKWSEKDIRLDLELEQVEYCGDEELLHQVWVNLIANAIKFSHQNGTLRVLLGSSRQSIRVQIIDTGMGIADGDKDRVFEMFYKGDQSRSNDGSGLGLSIVKKIVELHHGRVYFQSAPGQGTTFTVEFPKM